MTTTRTRFRIRISEPETQALKKILDDTQPTIFITVHSGTLGMYTPYAYSRDLPTNDPSDLGRMKNILDALDPEYGMYHVRRFCHFSFQGT